MKKYICKSFYSILIISLFTNPTFSQIVMGVNGYTEYHIGNLPIVISAPHGGNVNPTNIPDRTCNNPTFAYDIYTIELAKQIDSSLFSLTGARPHLIFCNLKRSKVDCNRNIADGACANIDAEIAWNEFHHFIDTAQLISKNQYSGKAFYIDLHGHGHTEQLLELGYLLSANELAFSDSILNTTQYINYSSIQNLVKTNLSNRSHAELLRGATALGTLLGNAGYPSVPSQQIPAPGSNPYFSGGYNTANYTSYFPNETSDGLQIETNYTRVRDTYANRKIFADSIASVLVNYFEKNYSLDLLNSNPNGINQNSIQKNWTIFPTSIQENQKIKFNSDQTGLYVFALYNLMGQLVDKGVVSEENFIRLSNGYNSGLYILSIENGHWSKQFKIFINKN